MRVIFLGTPEFAREVLIGIDGSRHELAAVVTQPDRVNARNNKVVFSAVKEYAAKQGIPVFQFGNINTEGEDALRLLNADIMVTAAYGQIIKSNILNLCPHGIINVHASLLPKYRGASPVQWALINGETVTGISIMRTELGIDTGAVMLQREMQLTGHENWAEALSALSKLGREAIVCALDLIESGQAVFTPQDGEKATRCGMLKKNDGKIDWTKSAAEIKNFIRGTTPWPGAFTKCRYGVLKILKAAALQDSPNGRAGEILSAHPKTGVTVKCGQGALSLETVQGENARAMDIGSYLLGKSLTAGEVLE